MDPFKPYRCVHVNLTKDINWQERTHHQYGFYIVLWFNDIPVGHLFIKPDEKLTSTRFEEKVIHAASWALKHYSGNTIHEARSINALRDLLSQVLDQPESIPPRADASVVVCTKDRPEFLKNCLESLRRLRCKPAEIVVVDNASLDNGTKKVVEAFPEVKYIRENRLGLDIARNTGAKTATRPIVVYTDDDTIIHPHWIYHVCKTFEDPNVMAMTGLVLASELNTEAQWIFERYWPFNRGFIDKRYDREFFNETLPKGPPVWNIGAGANMAFRKEIFSETGYFDERLDVGAAGCSGDSEIWYRLLAAGHEIHYNPRAVVWHIHRQAMNRFQQQIYYYMRGFTTAVLIQHQRFRHKGNLRHLFLQLPKYYSWLFLRGFPLYRGRYKTVFAEVKGILSGIWFYLKTRNQMQSPFTDNQPVPAGSKFKY